MSEPIASAPFPDRIFYSVPSLAMTTGACLGLCLSMETAEMLGTILLAASLLFCGLPHGAGDLWALRLASSANGWTSCKTRLCVLAYLAAALLTIAVWWLQPAVALGGFLALTAWHFGSADAALLTGNNSGGIAWWLQAVGRGAAIIAAPLAFHQDESARLLGPFALQNTGPVLELIRLLLVWAPKIAAVAFTLQGLAALPKILAFRTGQVMPDRLRAAAALAETCLIAALFLFAPPLLAFASYWIGAHCWRHILRLELLQIQHEASADSSNNARNAWAMVLDYHARTLEMTLCAIGGLVVIFLVWPSLATGANGWITAYFLLLSALTVPHAMVIAYLDWRTRHLPLPLLSS